MANNVNTCIDMENLNSNAVNLDPWDLGLVSSAKTKIFFPALCAALIGANAVP